ncbi:30S ribosomal protein S14 [Candidatus Vidania fulgoroideorum]
MSKKCLFQRELKRKKIFKKYFKKKNFLKKIIKKSNNINEIRKANFAIQALPKDSNIIRSRKRCLKTNRPRGYVGYFGISRITLRECISRGEIFGLIKS